MIAAIQAGGKSLRMGRDKAWVEISGRPLMTYCLEAVREVVDRTYVVISRDTPNPERYESLFQAGVAEVVVDSYVHCGPLGGIAAALEKTQADGQALILACDLPWVTPVFLRQLINAHEGAQVTVPSDVSGRIQMLCGIYEASCLPVITEMLESGVYRAQTLLERVSFREVPYPEYSMLPGAGSLLKNVNRPEDID